MNLKIIVCSLVLLGTFPVGAVDNWKPRVKDEFDIIFEGKGGKDAPSEATEDEPEPSPKVEEVAPVKPTESKPEAKKYKNLKSTPVKLQDGSKVKFDKVVVFSCANIPKKRYLFNKKQTDQCWIKNVKDAALIAEKIGLDSFKKKSSVFEICPESLTSEKACNPKLVRNF